MPNIGLDMARLEDDEIRRNVNNMRCRRNRVYDLNLDRPDEDIFDNEDLFSKAWTLSEKASIKMILFGPRKDPIVTKMTSKNGMKWTVRDYGYSN